MHEKLGVWASGTADEKRKDACWVTANELTTRIDLGMPDYCTAAMTPAQARTLARQLYRLARRVEARNAPEEKT